MMTIENQYKTFWPRLGAALLDGAALAPLSWLDQILWNTNTFAFVLFLWTLLYTIVGFAYSVGFLYFFGQTPGKMATGVVVQNHLGGKLKLRQAILRDIVPIIITPIMLLIVSKNLIAGQLANRGFGDDLHFLMGFGIIMIGWAGLEMITMLFNSKRRAIHDFIAGTVVVRQPIGERRAGHIKIRWVLIALFILKIIIPKLLPEKNMQINNPKTINKASNVVSADS